MKLELSDDMSNNSDFSNDSQNSQMSTADFMVSMGNGVLLTPTTTFITLEGLNSGVPTRTTPTLTPTTLRNIEQTFIEYQSKPESHENEAGFVPPLVHSIGNNQYVSASDAADICYNTALSSSAAAAIKNHLQLQTITNNNNNNNNNNNSNNSMSSWQHHNNSSLSQSSSDSFDTRSTPPPPPSSSSHLLHSSSNILAQKTSLINNTSLGLGGAHHHHHPTRRNMGGRKPNKDLSISPEEEERRRVRRERNKAAAARCRKRRVDHTNALIQETEELEIKKMNMREELQQLQMAKEELEYMLEAHRSSSTCRVPNQSPPDIKPFNNLQQQQQQNNSHQENNHHQNLQHAAAPSMFQIGSTCNSSSTNSTTTTTSSSSVTSRLNGGASLTNNERVKSESPSDHYKPPNSLSNSLSNSLTNHPVSMENAFSLPTSASKRIMLSSTVAITTTKPSRPNSLNVHSTPSSASNGINNNNNSNNNKSLNHLQQHGNSGNGVMEIGGVAITTPSAGIQFNFDSLMVGGTGLTPVSAPLVPNNCSQQQRSHNNNNNIPVSAGDLTSPDNCGPPKLVSL